ncbi:MAG: hypothetical protein AAFU73_16095 [Planctomycetota bacterium]
MADPTQTTQQPEDGELIHVPEGQSRLRYLLTLGLVLFLLVIFVVADNFSAAMTGRGGGRGDDIYLRWTDPLSSESVEVTQMNFSRSAKEIELGMRLGVYLPPSFRFQDPTKPQSSPDVDPDDVASFLIYERIATGSAVGVSDEEVKQRLRAIGDENTLAAFARSYDMSPRDVAEAVRRVLRVQKVMELVQTPLQVNDSTAATELWQEQVPEYKFQVGSLDVATVTEDAAAQLPADEELLRWFREDLDPRRRQGLYTKPRAVPEVIYLDFADEAFDRTALVEAFPLPEGADRDTLARSYYDFNRSRRFMRPTETEGEEGDDPAPATPYEFEEVKDQALAEAELKSALDALLTELQDQAAAAEEGTVLDLAPSAEKYGLQVGEVDPGGYLREDIAEVPGWGSREISAQLMFTPVGQLLPRVVVSESAITIARVASKTEAAEPALDDVRDEVTEMWVDGRAGELALERLTEVRDAFPREATDDPESAEAVPPTVTAAAFEAAVREAGLEFYDREYFGRGEKAGDDVEDLGEKFITAPGSFTVYTLEEGQVAAPTLTREGDSVHLARLDSTRAKDPKELTPTVHNGYRSRVRGTAFQEIGARLFRGDSAWMTERLGLEWPTREARAAEDAAAAAAAEAEGAE